MNLLPPDEFQILPWPEEVILQGPKGKGVQIPRWINGIQRSPSELLKG